MDGLAAGRTSRLAKLEDDEEDAWLEARLRNGTLLEPTEWDAHIGVFEGVEHRVKMAHIMATLRQDFARYDQDAPPSVESEDGVLNAPPMPAAALDKLVAKVDIIKGELERKVKHVLDAHAEARSSDVLRKLRAALIEGRSAYPNFAKLTSNLETLQETLGFTPPGTPPEPIVVIHKKVLREDAPLSPVSDDIDNELPSVRAPSEYVYYLDEDDIKRKEQAREEKRQQALLAAAEVAVADPTFDDGAQMLEQVAVSAAIKPGTMAKPEAAKATHDSEPLFRFDSGSDSDELPPLEVLLAMTPKAQQQGGKGGVPVQAAEGGNVQSGTEDLGIGGALKVTQDKIGRDVMFSADTMDVPPGAKRKKTGGKGGTSKGAETARSGSRADPARSGPKSAETTKALSKTVEATKSGLKATETVKSGTRVSVRHVPTPGGDGREGRRSMTGVGSEGRMGRVSVVSSGDARRGSAKRGRSGSMGAQGGVAVAAGAPRKKSGGQMQSGAAVKASALFEAASGVVEDEETQPLATRYGSRRRRRSEASMASKRQSTRLSTVSSAALEEVAADGENVESDVISTASDDSCENCRVARDAVVAQKMKIATLRKQQMVLVQRLMNKKNVSVKLDELAFDDRAIQCTLLDHAVPQAVHSAPQPVHVTQSDPITPPDVAPIVEKQKDAMRRLNADLYSTERALCRAIRRRKGLLGIIERREQGFMELYDRRTLHAHEDARAIVRRTRGGRLWALLRRKVRTLATHRRAVLLTATVLTLKRVDHSLLLDAISLLDSNMHRPEGLSRTASRSAAALHRTHTTATIAVELTKANALDTQMTEAFESYPTSGGLSRRSSMVSQPHSTGPSMSVTPSQPGFPDSPESMPTVRTRRVQSVGVLHGRNVLSTVNLKNPEKRPASMVYQFLLQQKDATGFRASAQFHADMQTCEHQYLAALKKQDEALAKQIGLIMVGCSKDDKFVEEINNVREGIEKREAFVRELEEIVQRAIDRMGPPAQLFEGGGTLVLQQGPPSSAPWPATRETSGCTRDVVNPRDRNAQLVSELESVSVDQSLIEAHAQLAGSKPDSQMTVRDRSPSFDNNWMKEDLLRELSQMRAQIIKKDSEIRSLVTQLEMQNVRHLLASAGTDLTHKSTSSRDLLRPDTQQTSRRPQTTDNVSASAALTLAMMEYDSLSEERDMLESRGRDVQPSPSRMTSPVGEAKGSFSSPPQKKSTSGTGRRKRGSLRPGKSESMGGRDARETKDVDFIDQTELFPSAVPRMLQSMGLPTACADVAVNTPLQFPGVMQDRSCQTEKLSEAAVIEAAEAESRALRAELKKLQRRTLQQVEAEDKSGTRLREAARVEKQLREEIGALRGALLAAKRAVSAYAQVFAKQGEELKAEIKRMFAVAASVVKTAVVDQLVESVGGGMVVSRLLWYNSPEGAGEEGALMRKKSLRTRARSEAGLRYEQWHAPDMIEDFLKQGDKWYRDRTGSKYVDADERDIRRAWYNVNFWKALRFVQSFREGWIPVARDMTFYPRSRHPGLGHGMLPGGAADAPARVPPFLLPPADTFDFTASAEERHLLPGGDGGPRVKLPVRGPRKASAAPEDASESDTTDGGDSSSVFGGFGTSDRSVSSEAEESPRAARASSRHGSMRFWLTERSGSQHGERGEGEQQGPSGPPRARGQADGGDRMSPSPRQKLRHRKHSRTGPARVHAGNESTSDPRVQSDAPSQEYSDGQSYGRDDDHGQPRAHPPRANAVSQEGRPPDERRTYEKMKSTTKQLAKMRSRVNHAARSLMDKVLYGVGSGDVPYVGVGAGPQLSQEEAEKLIKAATAHIQDLNKQQQEFNQFLTVLRQVPAGGAGTVGGAPAPGAGGAGRVARGLPSGGRVAASTRTLVLPSIYQPVPHAAGKGRAPPRDMRRVDGVRHEHEAPEHVAGQGYGPQPPAALVRTAEAQLELPDGDLSRGYLLGAMPQRSVQFRSPSRSSYNYDADDDRLASPARSHRSFGSREGSRAPSVQQEPQEPFAVEEFPTDIIPIPEAQSHRYSLIPSPPGRVKSLKMHPRGADDVQQNKVRLAAAEPPVEPVMVFPTGGPGMRLPLTLGRYTQKTSPPTGHGGGGGGAHRKRRLRRGKTLVEPVTTAEPMSEGEAGFAVGSIAPSEKPPRSPRKKPRQHAKAAAT